MPCDDPDAPYEFIPGGDACGTCESMAGCYPEPPSVPVHENCNCQVVGPDPDCYTETRNITSVSGMYVIDVPIGTFNNCGAIGTSIPVSVNQLIGFSYVEEGMETCAALLEEVGSVSPGTAVIPANSAGSIRAFVDMLWRDCMGELWEVCERPDGTEDETYIGDIGAYVETPAAVSRVIVNSSPC